MAVALAAVTPVSATVATATTVAAVATLTAVARGSLRRCACDFEQVALAVHDALADPDLHTQDTHFGERLGQAEIHVGTERVQRNTTLLYSFAAGHFGAAYTAGNLDLDTLGTHAHGRRYGRLHGAAERYLSLIHI